MAHGDTSSGFIRSVHRALGGLKNIQLALYEKVVDLSTAIDEIVYDSFSTLPQRGRRKHSTAPEAAGHLDGRHLEDRGNSGDATSLVSKLGHVGRSIGAEITPTAVILFTLGCLVMTLTIYTVAVYVRRRRRRRQQAKEEENKKFQKPNFTGQEMRLRPPGAPFAIPVYFRPQFETGNSLYRRISTSGGSAAGDAVGQEIYSGGVVHTDSQSPTQVKSSDKPAKQTREPGRSFRDFKQHHQQHLKTRTVPPPPTRAPAGGHMTQRNLSRLMVGSRGNSTGVTGELLVYALDLSGPQPEGFEQHGLLTGQPSKSPRRHNDDLSIPRVGREGLQGTQLRDSLPSSRRGFKPYSQRPRGSNQYAPQIQLQPSYGSTTTSPHRRDRDTNGAFAAREFGGVDSRAVIPSVRRTQSVSPGRYNSDQQSQPHMWKDPPTKPQKRQPSHPVHIQAPMHHMSMLKPKANPELVEPTRRWAGGLPRERICEIRQKTKQADTSTTEQTPKPVKPKSPERTKVTTKPNPTTAQISIDPKLYRENVSSLKRREGLVEQRKTIPQDQRTAMVVARKGISAESRRHKAATAVVNDGRPRFKTDWPTFFSSITSKHPKKKKTQGKNTKKKATKASTKKELKPSKPDVQAQVRKKPGGESQVLPIRPLVSPVRPPNSYTGELFELRKTATPNLSSLCGQGAFTSYKRDEPHPLPSALSDSVAWSSEHSLVNLDSASLVVESVVEALDPDPDPDPDPELTSDDGMKKTGEEVALPGTQGNQARHNTRFLSAMEAHSSSNDCSVVTEEKMLALDGGKWRIQLSQRGAVHHTVKSNAGKAEHAMDLDLSRGGYFKFKEFQDGGRHMIETMEEKHHLNKSNACTQETQGAPVGSFKTSTHAPLSICDKNHTKVQTNESKHRALVKPSNASTGLFGIKNGSICSSRSKSEPRKPEDELPKVAPLQFEMPMQEPLLNDIDHSLNTKSKKVGPFIGKKAGMGAYLEIANKLDSARKFGPDNSVGKQGSGIKDCPGPSLTKDMPGGKLTANTVFRITRNRVTTLKTQQGQASNTTAEPGPQTRKQLFQRQSRVMEKEDHRPKQPNQVFTKTFVQDCEANLDQTNCQPPQYNITTKETEQPQTPAAFHVRRFKGSCHNMFHLQTTFGSNKLTKTTGTAKPHVKEGSMSSSKEKYDSGNVLINNDMGKIVLPDKTGQANTKPSNKIRDQVEQSIPYSQNGPSQQRLNKDQHGFIVIANPKNAMRSKSDMPYPKETQREQREQRTDNSPVEKQSPESTDNSCTTSGATCSSDSQSSSSKYGNSSKDPSRNDLSLAYTEYSTGSKNLLSRKVSRKVKKSKSLISVNGVLTKFNSSAALKASCNSPLYHSPRHYGKLHKPYEKISKPAMTSSVSRPNRYVNDNNHPKNKRQFKPSANARFGTMDSHISPLRAREESARGDGVWFHRMRQLKSVRHEPYQKMMPSRQRESSILSRTQRAYLARNKNNCSPLKRVHAMTCAPILGNLSATDRISCCSDSLSGVSGPRDRQVQAWIDGVEDGATSLDKCLESDFNSEVCSLTMCGGQDVRLGKPAFYRSPTPVFTTNAKTKGSVASAGKLHASLPLQAEMSTDQSATTTHISGTTTGQSWSLEQESGEYSCTVSLAVTKQNTKSQGITKHPLVLPSDAARNVEQSDPCVDVSKPTISTQSRAPMFKENAACVTSIASLPTTKSHTTQTETSTLVSLSVAVQTSPASVSGPVGGGGGGGAGGRRKHRCRSSHLLQELMKHRAREMRLDRSTRHRNPPRQRTALIRRHHSLTAAWIFQQNSNVYSNNFTACINPFRQPPAAVVNPSCTKAEAKSKVLAPVNVTCPVSNKNAETDSLLPCKNEKQTDHSHQQDLYSQLQPVEPRKTEAPSIANHKSQEMRKVESTITESNALLAQQTASEINLDDNTHCVAPSQQLDDKNALRIKDLSVQRASFESPHVNQKSFVMEESQEESSSARLSELRRMCLVRPTWKNANIEEVDRRVKRALRLRRELQMSRPSSSGRRESLSLGANSGVEVEMNLMSQQVRRTMALEDSCRSPTRNSVNNKSNDFCFSDTSLADGSSMKFCCRKNGLPSSAERKSNNFSTDETGRSRTANSGTNQRATGSFRRTVSADLFSRESSNNVSVTQTAMPLCGITRQGSTVFTERSVSLQDLVAPIEPSKPGRERPSSASIPSYKQGEFSFSGSCHLKRSSLCARNKNSPPTKISKVDNQAFSGGTPRLVGSLVQRLPQVPLSSFVEWFIETSDPKNFVASEKSRTHSDDKTSGSKSASGEDVASVRRHGSVGGAPAVPEVMTRHQATPRYGTETSSPGEWESVTSAGTGKMLRDRVKQHSIDGATQLSSLSKMRNNPSQLSDAAFYNTKPNTEVDSAKGRTVPQRRPSVGTRSASLSSSKTPCLTDSRPSTACKVGPFLNLNISEAKKTEVCHNQVTASTADSNTDREHPQTYTCDEESAPFDNTVDTNKMYFKAPLHLCSEDADEEDYINDVDDDDTLDPSQRHEEDRTETQTSNSNLYWDAVKEKRAQPASNRRRSLYTPGEETGHRMTHMKKGGRRSANEFHCSLDALRNDNTNKSLPEDAPADLTLGDADVTDPRCAPGIRHILMKLQQPEEESGSSAVTSRNERVRITLRRSSDVSGIIAKFQK